MNNQDKAAEVISDLFHDAFHNHKGLGKDIAHALHNAGLLAEDLPEPSYTVTVFEQEHPVWDATLGFTVEAHSGRSDISIQCYYEPGESLTLAQARTIRQALHAAETYAAAQYSEGSNG